MNCDRDECLSTDVIKTYICTNPFDVRQLCPRCAKFQFPNYQQLSKVFDSLEPEDQKTLEFLGLIPDER